MNCRPVNHPALNGAPPSSSEEGKKCGIPEAQSPNRPEPLKRGWWVRPLSKDARVDGQVG